MDAPPRDLDAAYRRYRPLMLGALAYLAKRGLAAPFGDGLDLVHDFFLDEYAGLIERHDSARSEFTTYLYAAFVRYARPRILRMGRWRAALRTAGSDEADVTDSATTSLDRAAIAAAMSALSGEDQELLLWRFGDELSERAIASRRATTRYAIRQATLHALGRLVVALDDEALTDHRERAIARALWTEDRSLHETAERLELTVEQVRRISEGLLAQFARGLGGGKEQ